MRVLAGFFVDNLYGIGSTRHGSAPYVHVSRRYYAGSRHRNSAEGLFILGAFGILASIILLWLHAEYSLGEEVGTAAWLGVGLSPIPVFLASARDGRSRAQAVGAVCAIWAALALGFSFFSTEDNVGAQLGKSAVSNLARLASEVSPSFDPRPVQEWINDQEPLIDISVPIPGGGQAGFRPTEQQVGLTFIGFLWPFAAAGLLVVVVSSMGSALHHGLKRFARIASGRAKLPWRATARAVFKPPG